MAKNETRADKTPKRRTQVKELPKEEKRLSGDEQKKVKGGSFSWGFTNSDAK